MHITWVLNAFSRSRLAFIQSLISAMHAVRQATAAVASLAAVETMCVFLHFSELADVK